MENSGPETRRTYLIVAVETRADAARLRKAIHAKARDTGISEFDFILGPDRLVMQVWKSAIDTEDLYATVDRGVQGFMSLVKRLRDAKST
jgi:hypothetical protein